MEISFGTKEDGIRLMLIFGLRLLLTTLKGL